jgi:hypothetical protein
MCCRVDAIPSSKRAGHSTLSTQLFEVALIGHTELASGYEFQFDAARLEDLARFVALERLCCPFLHFVIEFDGEREGVRLRITGPVGSKQVIETEMLRSE